ncbi:MAG: Na+:solute symporter [Amphiplicatus sp.]
MGVSAIDLGVILVYLAASVGLGFWASRAAAKSTRHYFLGGNRLPWYALGVSNASGMFDISGTMWLVLLLFVFGLKSLWIPWLWPTFNQIFLMVFLSAWLRRSGVMTGAEWITFRFGDGPGARLSHLVVVVFALVSVIGFLAYGFVGIGKFAASFLPFQLSADPRQNEIYYGLLIVGLTSIYVIKGGMFSVVITEVMQFLIMTVGCVAVAIIAMNAVSPEMLRAAVPEGWASPFFGYEVDLDWSEILPHANDLLVSEDYSPFAIFFMLTLFKGVMISLAGPAPNYDMQRILSARSPRDAAKMSALVSVVLNPPRYLLVAGLTVLALAFFTPTLRAQGANADFELILPFALKNYVPPGLLGLLIAGLLAAFMSTFAATVNAAPAYVVHDIYRRYVNPNAPEKVYVWASYVTAAVFVIVGTLIGLQMPSLNKIILWIVSALWGGYAAANVLKWYWWRFNGYGYFWGMAVGVVGALWLANQPDISALYAFPAMFALTVLACVLGARLTPPTDMETLMKFYERTRPWGFWGPVRRALAAKGTPVAPNRDFARDMFNVAVGIVWQTALVAAPVYLVIRDMTGMWIALAIAAIGATILKFTWYDHLKDDPDEAPAEKRAVAPAAKGAPL